MTTSLFVMNIHDSDTASIPLDIAEHFPPVPLDTLPEQLPSDFLTMKIQDYVVGFSGRTSSYCVGTVDIIDSTKISARLSLEKSAKYYEIFLNTMARVLNRFGGMIVKNVGDSLLFYFPESSKGRRYGFMTCLEGSSVLCIGYPKQVQAPKAQKRSQGLVHVVWD